MGRFEIILWDIDQTLLDFKKSQEYALQHSFMQFGRKIDDTVKAQYDQQDEGKGEKMAGDTGIGKIRGLH